MISRLAAVILMVAVFFLGITCGRTVFAGGNNNPGTEYDPLVAQSYVHHEVESRVFSLRQQIDNLQKKVFTLQEAVTRLERQVKAQGAEPAGSIEEKNTGQVGKLGLINAETGANLRTGPGTGYHSIGVIPNDTEVVIFAVAGDWCQVEADGKRGWIHRELINFK